MAEIEQLEHVDESLLRKILEVGHGCPKEMLYLELGCTPLRYIIMMRTIMFLQYILQEQSSSLISQVLQAQSESPSKNDFILKVKEDQEDLEIDLSFEDIKSLSKDSFSNFVKKQLGEKALQFINKKKLEHSKVRHIKHDELKMQAYLQASNVRSVSLAKFLFSARTRMLDVGGNFSQRNEGKIKCKLGCNEEDTQRHLLICPFLAQNHVRNPNDKSEYEDLFSSQVEDQFKIAAIMKTKYRMRKEKFKT